MDYIRDEDKLTLHVSQNMSVSLGKTKSYSQFQNAVNESERERFRFVAVVDVAIVGCRQSVCHFAGLSKLEVPKPDVA